jgi:glycosyltransferase involved in cell wall biosynthesis
MDPKISVIFPVGKGEDYLKYLRPAIESILRQSLTDFEFLIIEDGVSSQIESIIDSYQDYRIKRLKFPINMGASAARNAGLLMVKAPYIAVMDSDDVAMPDRFARQYTWMESHHDVTVCGSNFIKMFGDGIRTSVCYPESDGMIKSLLLVVDSAIHNPTTMFRTEFVRKYRLQYDANFPRDHDYRFFVEMMRNGARFYGLQEELLLYRRHEGNITNGRLGLDEEKTKVREILLPIFFPELTGEEGRILLIGFCEHIKMTMMEAYYCIITMSKALRENRTLIGEDREELKKIIQYYLERLLKLVNGTTNAGHQVDPE